MTSAPAQESEKMLERAMARHQYSSDALIEMLHAAQQLYGYLSPALLKTIARKLKLPPSRVLGVATFYHLFRVTPCRKHSAIVCMGTACYAAGSRELFSILRSADSDEWTVNVGRCVGSCGLTPVVVCDGAVLSRATQSQVRARLSEGVA